MSGRARPWFVDAVLLAVCAAVVLAAAVATPGVDVVSFFGHEVPVLCAFRRLTGMSCPGCGLTRSFAFLAHGQLVAGFRSNWFGPLLFAFVAGQVPYRLYRIAVGASGSATPAG